MIMIRLAWFSPHPVHYNTFLFEKLVQSLPLKLDLFFFHRVLSNYPWKNTGHPPSAYVLRKSAGVDWILILQFIFLRSKKFDFIVVAGWSEPTMIVLLSFFRVSGRKYILYTDTPQEQRKSNLKQWIRKKWLQWILSGSYAVLVTGKKGFSTLEKWGARKNAIYNFPFATDLNHFSPANDFPRPFMSYMKLFSSGRLDLTHKGYDIALRALAMIKARRPEIKFEYMIAGSGPDENAVRNLIVELGLEKEVRLLGWIETDTLLQQYRQADILLHTAIHDPFPNAVLEAMACGLIVIGSDTSGSVIERIETRVNGMMHVTHDFESVYDALAYLYDLKGEEIIALKKNALETARKWEVTYNVELLNTLFNKE